MVSYTLKPTALFCSTNFNNGDDFLFILPINTPVHVIYVHDGYLCIIYNSNNNSYIGFIPDSSMVYYE